MPSDSRIGALGVSGLHEATPLPPPGSASPMTLGRPPVPTEQIQHAVGEAPRSMGSEATPRGDGSSEPSMQSTASAQAASTAGSSSEMLLAADPAADERGAGCLGADPPTIDDQEAQTECIICLNEMAAGDEQCSELVCGHRFHRPCIEEWLDKDGRCPVCRHREREVEAAAPDLRFAAPLGLRSMAATAMLILESRRLMMLASMEAALAVLVMSYVADAISPALMILAACIVFVGASHYLPRCIGVARVLLAINALYHVFLIFAIMQAKDGSKFFSHHVGTARTVLLSIGCVTFMEVSMLKKCELFLMRLRAAPPIELRALRVQRNMQGGWAQRIIVLIMFMLVTAPVAARWVCQAGGSSEGSSCS
eukprot:CAMPEP_0115829910 /NCGR_PEP_ID=MMETSP0287-20121206/1342_1 /TAXON_ID=412157 /ORGANISM="Chrysochromulina rotalis, Strain UIO044" /LENGTH=366 /DNA_ID=CAMNT_0003283191 /DNA_START=744 /DNA_END=1844 /DNA_ORIENTATION=-